MSAAGTNAIEAAPRRVLIPPQLPPARQLGRGALGLPVWSLTGETMGTHWRARVIARPSNTTDDKADARGVITTALDRVVALMSPWETSSDLGRFAAAPAGARVTLARETSLVLDRALAVARLTDGAYDPSLGTVIDLLGFGPTDPSRRHDPDHPTVKAARHAAGFDRLDFNPTTHTVRQPGGVRLDLCSIAKGYAVDLASDALHRVGWTNHFIEIGGDARGRGCKADGQPWWCALDPVSGAPETVAALFDHAVATSGNTHHFFNHPSGRVGHIVPRVAPDPASPATETIVTVLAPACIDADVWATALHLLGPDLGRDLAESHQLAACWFLPPGRSRLAGSEVRTSAFDGLLT
ncbi:FAD:protein FMN transferase [Synoicihabitans lomoniglobus]|uniref:FAD:protein FMN transferase n=1 Tax=Synoicihabitans lomoniglobus TaxID=2909285 RepID=A0AAE9ZYN7_9BACT|nr:FAD:protein FMN transferase [Opitutaceae bacterium LMO-M01]WED65500.1 FAD:protein FMN transferase [Opitutaceae bacterium LMO-M01]